MLHWGWPNMGAKGLRTKYGLINGSLIYCDGSISIFNTPDGKITIPFNELLNPFGKSYQAAKTKQHVGESQNHQVLSSER
jgi:hypothetical protein